MNIWQKLLFAWLFVTVWLHPILSKPCAQEPIFYSNLDPNNEVIRICSTAIESMFVGVNIGAALFDKEYSAQIDLFRLEFFNARHKPGSDYYQKKGRVFEITLIFTINFNGPFTIVDYPNIQCSDRNAENIEAEIVLTGGAQMAMTLQLEESRLCGALERIQNPCQVCWGAPWSVTKISALYLPVVQDAKFAVDSVLDYFLSSFKTYAVKTVMNTLASGHAGETAQQFVLDFAAKQISKELNKKSWEVRDIEGGEVAIVLNVVDKWTKKNKKIMLQIPKIQ